MKHIRLLKTLKSRLIVISLLFLTLGIALPVTITSRIFLEQIQTKNEEDTVVNFSRTATRINELLSAAAASALRLQTKDEIHNYLTAGYQQEDAVQKTMDQLKFLKTIEETFVINDSLNAVLFFRKDGTMCGASSSWNFFVEDRQHPFFANQAFHDAVRTGGDTVWLGAFPKNEFTQTPLSGTLMPSDLLICGVRKLTYALQPIAYNDITMLVSVNEQSLRACFEFISDENSSVCLLDKNGEQISGADFSSFGKTPDYYSLIDRDSHYGSVFYTSEEGHEEYQVVYYRLEQPDWMLIKQVPTRVQYQSTNALRNSALGIGVVFLLLTASLYTLWAIRFTQPINGVTRALAQARDGNLCVRIEENAKVDEVAVMQQQFNQMLGSINDLLTQKEKNEQEKLLLEMRSLQSQIDPHFIYNTITSIRWMATMAGADRVADMLVVLISLLRPIFGDWTLDWTLDEELTFTENYMKLMRMRYGNRVSMEIHEDAGSSSIGLIKIPRFTLQPLLENCCEHGIRPDQPLRVTIDIFRSDDRFTIRVTDNGAGVPEETLRWLNARFSEPLSTPAPERPKNNGRSSGIGLININRRLKLRFGERFGLTINNLPDGGTCVEVQIDSPDA